MMNEIKRGIVGRTPEGKRVRAGLAVLTVGAGIATGVATVNNNGQDIEEATRSALLNRTGTAQVLSTQIRVEQTNAAQFPTLTVTPTATRVTLETATTIPTSTATETPTITPTNTEIPKVATATAFTSGFETQVAGGPELAVEPSNNPNPRLADFNQEKVPGRGSKTWETILDPKSSHDAQNNLFFTALSTKPGANFGIPNSDPSLNFDLGHSAEVTYVTAAYLAEHSEKKVKEFLTSEGNLTMGGVIGGIEDAAGFTALLEIGAATPDKTLREIYNDPFLMNKIAIRKNAILGKSVLFTGTDSSQAAQDAKAFKDVPAQIWQGDNQYTTCEQDAVPNDKTGTRVETNTISARVVTYASGNKKTFTSADTTDETNFVPFTLKKDTSGKVVVGDFVATDRDFLWLTNPSNKSQDLLLMALIEEQWATEDIYRLCGSKAVPRRETLQSLLHPTITSVFPDNSPTPGVIPSTMPDQTPHTPVVPSKTPFIPTATNAGTNIPPASPTLQAPATATRLPDVTRKPTQEQPPTKIPPVATVPPAAPTNIQFK